MIIYHKICDKLSQERIQDFYGNLGISFLVPYTKDFGRITQF